MFGEEQREESEESNPRDYTGLIIAALLSPIYLIFMSLGREDVGFALCIVSGVIIVAMKFRWELRGHVWFWVISVLALVINVPVALAFRAPKGVPTLAYALPFGFLEYGLVWGALGLADKLFSESSKKDKDPEQ